ncbi:MAG: hypothetical protein VCD00_00940 [Candidatus Hydrogenedentota bacterium]
MAVVKRFLILFVLAYLIVSTGINRTLGPPGMSKDYLAEYKSDHNRYIEAIKNKEYKTWKQRPHLVDMEADKNAGLQERIDFVAEYEIRPLFLKEERRRGRYELIFDFFNTIMVIVLVGRFARKPVIGLVDGMIEAIRFKIKEAEDAKREASERLDAVEHKIKGLPQDLAGYEELAEERIENIRRDSALFTGESISNLNKETEDRKRFEIVKARHLMKERMVDAAIEQVVTAIRESDSTERDEVLIDQFMANLKEKAQ